MDQRLTPVDIVNHRFGRGFRGYRASEVDDFVRRVSTDLEHALTEIADLRERLAASDKLVAHYRSIEDTLKDSLLLAQKAADETRASARLQAETHLKTAQARAQELDLRLHDEVRELTDQIDRLRQERRRLARDLRAQLLAQLEWLKEEIETDQPLFAPSPIEPLTLAAGPPASTNGDHVNAVVEAQSAALANASVDEPAAS
jgi:cell division initiation protein